VDRCAGEAGVCGELDVLRLAAAGLHFGEEPPLTGKGGSGTLFVAGCSMGCPFCQNHQISRGGIGRAVGKDEFTAICAALEAAGAVNINLVTPSHMTPTLAEYIGAARGEGFTLPAAWNSSGYESLEAVDLASSVTDIWLPDLKTLDRGTAERIYGLPDYPFHAARAILRMAESGPPVCGADGRMTGGLMVRHLALPGGMDSSRGVLEWFARNLKGRAWLSLMTQYTPVRVPGERRTIPERQLKRFEYDFLLELLEEYGIDDGFVQGMAAGDEWLPDFGRKNPFSANLSRILWHWDTGFVRD
jgi:putative pyruvate formate lyase activating enzyme